MLDLVLVTANFGGIDDLKPFPRSAEFDRYYYTDEVTLARASPETAATWTRVMVPDYPRHDFGPRLRAKYFKCQIHRLPETQPYRWLAWADSAFLFHDTSFLREGIERLRRLPARSRLMLRPHPKRTSVRSEYEYVVQSMQRGSQYLLRRYSGEKMDEQMAFYEREGWNIDAKLWSGGLWLVENNKVIGECWNSWWDQNIRFGIMDQLSLPVVLEHHGLDPQAFPFTHSGNGHFERLPHQLNV